MAIRHSLQLAGKEPELDIYPQRLVEANNSAKTKQVLDLYSSAVQNFN